MTPIPPPRRRKRNKGRPLPPKPDEVGTENSSNVDRTETGNEPLYSSVRSPKSSGDEQEAEEKARPYEDCEGKRTKEIYEHKASMRSKFTAIRYSARIFTLAATRKQWKICETNIDATLGNIYGSRRNKIQLSLLLSARTDREPFFFEISIRTN